MKCVMHPARRLVIIAAMLLPACGGGSSPASPDTKENQPPSITFGYTPLGVPRNTTVELSVTVSDADGDALTVAWSVTRGSLAAVDAAKTRMNWTAPQQPGIDTVRVTVSDGQATREIVEPIYVCTRVTSTDFAGQWSAPGSPYLLQPAGGRMAAGAATTTIEPGVVFLFGAQGGSVQIEGTVIAHGTESAPIVFRPDDRTLRCQSGRGWWDGIEVRGAAGMADFDWVEVWYGRQNVLLLDSGSATLRHCALRCGQEAGVMISSSGALIVDSCAVDNNAGAGISVQSLTALPDSVIVRHSTISINGVSGVNLSLNDVAKSVPVRIERNVIEFNFTFGIFVTRNVFPTIHYNRFEANGLSNQLSNVWLEAPYPDGVAFDTLDATYNYWGGTFASAADIEPLIHDRLDDFSIGTKIRVDPWLNTSPVR